MGITRAEDTCHLAAYCGHLLLAGLYEMIVIHPSLASYVGRPDPILCVILARPNSRCIHPKVVRILRTRDWMATMPLNCLARLV